MDEPCIDVRKVSMVYTTLEGPVQALTDVNLTVDEGEFVAVVGPTACGKTTLLKIISGILAPTEGEVRIRGGSVAEALAANVFGFVFQDPVLLPWRTALENVRLPLEVIGTERSRRSVRAADLLTFVGLGDALSRYPHQLSGGMQQRVSITRALVFAPSILLMDEPFSALDVITKHRLHVDFLTLWGQERKTVVFITHDIAEAVFLADRVAVLANGRLVRVMPVDLPRPRTEDTRETLPFVEHVKILRVTLEEAIRAST